MGTDRLSPSQRIRAIALENAVNQLSPNDTVESILNVARFFENYISRGDLPASVNVVALPNSKPSTGNTVRRLSSNASNPF